MRPSLVVQLVSNLSAMWETWVQSLGWENLLEKGKTTHSSILAWRIPWTVQSMGLQRVGHNLAIFTSLHTCMKLTNNSLHILSLQLNDRKLSEKNNKRHKHTKTMRRNSSNIFGAKKALERVISQAYNVGSSLSRQRQVELSSRTTPGDENKLLFLLNPSRKWQFYSTENGSRENQNLPLMVYHSQMSFDPNFSIWKQKGHSQYKQIF